MVSLSTSDKSSPVLEPSSGAGAFLDALHRAGFQDVTGVEIDSDIAHHEKYEVQNSSFITWNVDRTYSLVIGNPPYIRWKDLDDEQKNELKGHRLFGTLLNALSDYLLPFIALSIEKLSPEGELIFITPSFWLQTKHSQMLRDYLAENGQITDLVDFGESRIFKDVATSLIVFRFVKSSQPQKTRLHRFVGNKVFDKQLDLSDKTQFRSEEISSLASKGKFIPAFDDEIQAPLNLEKYCESHGTKTVLGDIVRIANGMVTGLDAAFKLSEADVASLPASEKSGISKIVKGKNLERLISREFTHYIDIDPKISFEEASTNYPNLLNLLEPWKDELLKRYAYDDGLRWWLWSFYRSENFHRAAIQHGFVPGKERLTHKTHVRFSLADENAVATQDVTAFAPLSGTKEDIKYIVAYLNLDVVSEWVRVFGLMKGGVAEFSEKPLSEIPFRRINWLDPKEVQIHSEICQIVSNAESGILPLTDAQTQLANKFGSLMPGFK